MDFLLDKTMVTNDDEFWSMWIDGAEETGGDVREKSAGLGEKEGQMAGDGEGDRMTDVGGEGSGQKAGLGEGDGHTGGGEGDVTTDVGGEDGLTSAAAMDVVSDLDGEGVAMEIEVGKDPELGMEFESREAVYDFYKAYGKRLGFPIRTRSTTKDKKGVKIVSIVLECLRAGQRGSQSKNQLKPQPSMQIGCGARLRAHVNSEGLWEISKLFVQHSHPMSPTKARLFRCHRKLTHGMARKLAINEVAGIRLNKSFTTAVVEAGGYDQLPFIEKDCRNYIDKVRQLRLGSGDAIAIQGFFAKMQDQCPGFFFALDLDDESRLRNVFWADNRSRYAYKEFGDVITFDTTYLTNRYDMPFAPFVGVNHHGKSLLMGCGLVSNEDTQTFVWLFKAWLECMNGIAPMGIITDQDRAMQNAIAIVFPNSKHRWCLWHIMKKVPEKLGGNAQKDEILDVIHDCIYDSQYTQEFEEKWLDMVQRFSLEEHDWLGVMYNERNRWVPCYLKPTFWAGMSTTQRSESINAFFDKFVNSKTTLKQFVEQYGCALRDKVEKEFQADTNSFTKMIPCVTRYPMEKQVQQIYTLSKFAEFQRELLEGKLYCDILLCEDGRKYTVQEHMDINGFKKNVNFYIDFDPITCFGICSCHLFEFRGMICRHLLVVFNRLDIHHLPEVYLMSRWRKDMKRAYQRVKINYDGWITTVEQQRFDKLCKTFESVANMIVDDEAKYNEVLLWLETQLTTYTPLVSHSCIVGNMTPLEDPKTNIHAEVPLPPIGDPKCTKRKGAPRKNRAKGPLEKGKKGRPKKDNARPTTTTQHGNGEGPGHGAANGPIMYSTGLDLNLSLM
ncbi:unnamed protein product [Cuscuta epithymum]|uniref:Protein FAR1-RELATED SEQUENCE n=1 Tax=Cuscuta epithymum TaxID=186058 RepID=A0AAV0E992_9ASTE|nr:unnamed protein product [Cuscuta epithymum]CAH9144554.1 unnamed protein product [Cuscuta epithymum]